MGAVSRYAKCWLQAVKNGTNPKASTGHVILQQVTGNYH